MSLIHALVTDIVKLFRYTAFTHFSSHVTAIWTAGNCHYWKWRLIWQMQTTCLFFYGTNWSPAANSGQRGPWSYHPDNSLPSLPAWRYNRRVSEADLHRNNYTFGTIRCHKTLAHCSRAMILPGGDNKRIMLFQILCLISEIILSTWYLHMTYLGHVNHNL